MPSFFRTSQAVSLALLVGVLGFPKFSQAQSNELSQDNVIMIGGSPEEWSYYSNYWQQLVNLNPAPETQDADFEADEFNPEMQQKAIAKLAKNVVVKNLRQDFIIKLNGSSQISGSVTNRNKEAVVVQGINFELRDSSGELLQTGSAVPTPNRLAPGQTATFSETLLTVPVDENLKLMLSKPGVIVQPVNDGQDIAVR